MATFTLRFTWIFFLACWQQTWEISFRKIQDEIICCFYRCQRRDSKTWILTAILVCQVSASGSFSAGCSLSVSWVFPTDWPIPHLFKLQATACLCLSHVIIMGASIWGCEPFDRHLTKSITLTISLHYSLQSHSTDEETETKRAETIGPKYPFKTVSTPRPGLARPPPFFHAWLNPEPCCL